LNTLRRAWWTDVHAMSSVVDKRRHSHNFQLFFKKSAMKDVRYQKYYIISFPFFARCMFCNTQT
jgi:hypothetical protein